VKPIDFFLKKNGISQFADQVKNSNQAVATPLRTEEKSVVDVADQASTSVVTISIKQQPRIQTSMPSFFGFEGFGFSQPQVQQPQNTQPTQHDIGTGFVVDKGLVVTSKHVVSAGSEYFVYDRNDKEHKVTNIYRDPSNDLAILKVDDLQAPALKLGDSDTLKVGQSVIAIGTALGEFRHTVTTGVVSGLGRGIEAGDSFGSSVESLENVIQTDAAINPGNSGGPLLDSAGQVIGINTAVSQQGQNIGFAIPINVIKTSLANFDQTGKFDRPFLGIRFQPISQQTAIYNNLPQGDYLIEVIPNSSAADAGLQQGDIITDFDGKNLKDNDITKLIGSKKIGDKVKIKYWRKDQQKEIEMQLKAEPAASPTP
jgi:S1-C subfamily serine protease